MSRRLPIAGESIEFAPTERAVRTSFSPFDPFALAPRQYCINIINYFQHVVTRLHVGTEKRYFADLNITRGFYI